MATLKVPHQVGDLGAYLKEQRENARLSLRQLAMVAGVSNPYLSQIERGLRKPSAEVLQQIAKGLQISAEALFLRAGLLEGTGGLEVEVAVQSDVHLTARQKRVLLDIYATFRAENARSAVSSDEVSAAPTGGAALKPSPNAVEGSGGERTRADQADSGDPADGMQNEVAPKRTARKRASVAAKAAGSVAGGRAAAAAAPTSRPARPTRAARSPRAGRGQPTP